MHNFTEGDAFRVIADAWVDVGPGHQRNVGTSVTGKVASTDYLPGRRSESGRHIVRLEDGRVFERYDCYCAYSPYGWNPHKG